MGNRRTSTAQRPVLPGDADMLGTLAKRRSTPRVPTLRIAWITFTSWLEHEHLALVKDISERGVFFYSDFRPGVGDRLDFVVEFLTGSDKVRLHLKGKVLRVEQAAPGSAPGVAILFSTQESPEEPMETFAKLFGSLLALVYHCFDRIVILGHLPLLTRPENIVHFFRDVHGVGAITKEVLRQRTTEYNQWVEAFGRNHGIPIEWAEKGVRKEDYVRPRLGRTEREGRFGVYFILKSMEVGTNFRVAMPKYPTADPDYRILTRQRSRHTHYYFYIRDQVLGAMALRVGSF